MTVDDQGLIAIKVVGKVTRGQEKQGRFKVSPYILHEPCRLRCERSSLYQKWVLYGGGNSSS